jgi:serine/threonine protein kinase
MVKFRAVLHNNYLILFKNEYKNKVKHIYCLTTTFIQKAKNKETIGNIQYYHFELIMRMKKRNFYMKQEYSFKLLTELLDIHKNIEAEYTFDHIIYQHGNIKVISAVDNHGQKVIIKRLAKYNRKKDHEHALNEIELMKRLRHENIVKYINCFEDNDNLYIVIEDLEGGDLSTYLSERKESLTDEDLIRIIHDITCGIEYLHKIGIMHRDLKLKNIAMTCSSNKATAKLIDFGLSLFHNDGYLNDCCGTKYFTAPEVMKNNYNIKADIWSFGVIVYFLIYNKFPFMTDSSNIDDYILLFPTTSHKFKFDVNELISGCLKFDTRSRYSIRNVSDILK